MRAVRRGGVEHVENSVSRMNVRGFNNRADENHGKFLAGICLRRRSLRHHTYPPNSPERSRCRAGIGAGLVGVLIPPKTVCFRPCAIVNSLLITSLRAAECTASRRPVELPTLFRASPCFGNANKTGGIHWAKAESISWGVPNAYPNRTDTFRLMVMQSGNQMTNLPRRFLRENAGAKTLKSKPQVKGR